MGKPTSPGRVGMGTTEPPGSPRALDPSLARPRHVTAFLALSAERLRKAELGTALRGLALVSLGLYSHYWLLLNVSGFRSPCSALACMLVTRSLLAHPYLHVNIFQVRCPPPWALGG